MSSYYKNNIINVKYKRDVENRMLHCDQEWSAWRTLLLQNTKAKNF
jgi:hypothetical protein